MVTGFYRMLPAALSAAFVSLPGPARAQCSVLDGRPCAPSVCSVFDPAPCSRDLPYPYGDHLRITVQSRPERQAPERQTPPGQHVLPERLDNFHDLDAALRRCWLPPAPDQGKAGTEMTIVLSFNRAGDILGEPRFVYMTPGASADLRAAYQRAVVATIKRCTPLPLTETFGAALAGRVFRLRFIDNGGPPKPEKKT